MARKSVKSQLEELFEAQLKMSRLPAMQREYLFSAERKWRFDFADPNLKIALEIQGGTWVGGRHNRPKGYEEDLIKLNEAALEGWLVICATTGQIKAGVALSWVRRAFEAMSGEGL